MVGGILLPQIKVINYDIIFRPFSPPYDDTGLTLSIAIFYPLCGLGIVGNIITIATILWSSKLK